MTNAKNKKAWIALLIALAVFACSIIFAWVVDTDGGKIDVQSVYFTSNQDGSLMHGRLYVPQNATPETPAPAVLYIHGNDGDSDKYSMFSVELSRRGFVVLNMDMRNQGQSVKNPDGVNDGTNGATEGTQYLQALSFVDSDNICIGGHSMGGTSSFSAYSLHPDWYNTVFGHAISSSFIDVADDAKVNVFLITSREEDDCVDWTRVADIFGYGCTVKEWEPNTVYGSFEEGNARMNLQSMHTIHNSVYIERECIAETVNFLCNATNPVNPYDGYQQVWQWRYIWTGVALVALIFMFVPLGSILLSTPFFAPIIQPLPEYKGNTKGKWWVFAIITALFPPAVYFSWSSIGDQWLPSIFAVRRATLTLSWALLVAFVTVGILVVCRLFVKKEDRPVWENYGLSLPKAGGLVILLKTLLLAAILWILVYSLLSLAYSWSLIDVRMWNNSFRVLDWRRVCRIFIYIVPFMFVYLVTGANLHGTLRAKNGTLSLGKEMLINILMLAPFYFVWMIWFGPFAWIKQNGGIPSFAGHMYSFFWALPVTMTIIASISTFFFRKTGRIYLGAFVNAWIVCWSILGGFS